MAASHYEVDSVRAHDFGVLAQVALPEQNDAVPPPVLARLAPEERALASSFHGFRQIEFVGGRLAYHAAAATFGDHPPLLTAAGGVPTASAALTVSLSHKRNAAVALVASAAHGTVGVDLENDVRPRLAIASRVLSVTEQQVFDSLSEALRWPYLQRVFALKEATYKAIYPHLRRFVGFGEASVSFDGREQAHIQLNLKRSSERPLVLEARWSQVPDGVLASVRARPV
jgi:4'-phosphopantetheinyl transferase EntD